MVGSERAEGMKMARNTDFWVATHPADGSQLPGVRVSWEAFRNFDEHLGELVLSLESRWHAWVTVGSARTSGKTARQSSWPVGTSEGND